MPTTARRGPVNPAAMPVPSEGTLSRQLSEISLTLDPTRPVAIRPHVMPSMTAISELHALLPDIANVATDKEGSRKLQTILNSVPDEEREHVYTGLKPFFHDLMEHSSGNYVVQRILYYSTSEQRDTLNTLIGERAIELSKHTFGCRVVQKALETTKGRDLACYFKTHVLKLSGDRHGNHVLQRLLETFPDCAEFIAKELQGNVFAISCQKYGCRVVQRLVGVLVENSTPSSLAIIRSIVDEVIVDLRLLTDDEFGNYVVQAVMKCKQECGLKPVYLLRGLYGILCRHKHASNVVETAFSVAPPSLRDALLEELCPFMTQLATDQFGNFVVQRVYELCDTSQKARIAKSLNSGAAVLKTHVYGRSVMNMLVRSRIDAELKEDPLITWRKKEAIKRARIDAELRADPLITWRKQETLADLKLPPSFYYPTGQQPTGPHPSSPVTPLTTTTTATTTTTSGDWTHNPNYDLPDTSSCYPQQATTTLEQSDSWAHTSYDSEYAY
eukprot:TRINITY_DN5016_c0_g1_i1.p1 TRINITY_DN5016_c0_g1~~TRINITY_DN5016_c0_g1_i1.p1  ORF type:complete len:518 (+),score=92.69 TRINITY_DN5016_c0_g1_i1:55-1554(+)